MRDLILEAVRAEPGELTPEALAAELGATAADIYALTRRGDLLPRRYRLYDHPRATQIGVLDTALDARVIQALVENGPQTRKSLARILRYDEAEAPGALKASLKRLYVRGSVAPPRCLWAAP